MRAAAAGIALAAALAAAACSAPAPSVTAGNPDRGLLLLRQFGCASCHVIPGVASAMGNVGPPLERIASRVYLAGILPNTPENLMRWIRAPQSVDPLTAMPDLGVSEAQARDMAAYLFMLH